MENLNYKQLLALVDDVLNGQWHGDTSKPIMIWFWSDFDLATIREQLEEIRELATFQEHPVRHSTYMFLGDKTVRVADHLEYAKRFCLPSSFKNYTKGFLYYRMVQQFSPEYLYDCRELIQNTHLPLIGFVNDYEKEACEKKGNTVDMDAFVNYRYIGKTMQEWMEAATAIQKDGLPELLPCITDFVSDEPIKDLFFYNDEEPNSIELDKRVFAPDGWYDVNRHLLESYFDYHNDLFASKYNNAIDFLNGEFGLGLSAIATKEEVRARVDTILDGQTRKLAREVAGWFGSFPFKKPKGVTRSEVYADVVDYLVSGNAENDVCGHSPMNRCQEFYVQWIEWLKARGNR